jgi:uncharacterized membrane protein
MTNLEKKLKKNCPIWNKKNFTIAIVLFSLLGFIDASYLTINHYFNAPLPCSFFDGCDLVTRSVYSQIMGIPIALLGSFYYLFLFFVSFLILINGEKIKLMKWIYSVSFLGFLISLILVYLQIFVLRALCLYCMLSFLFTTLIFFSSILYKKL